MFVGDLEDCWPPVATLKVARPARRSPTDTRAFMASPDRHKTDDNARRRCGKTYARPRAGRILQRDIEVAIRPLREIAHPAELGEQDLLTHHLTALDLESSELLAGKAAHK